MDYYTIYTDGACDGNGKSGSSAIVFKNGVFFDYFIDSWANSTNNRAEARGVKLALDNMPGDLQIISDSQYVIGTLTKGWIESWEKSNYEGKKNADIWRDLYKLKQTRNFSLKWVKGHNEDIGNELADAFAVIARKTINPKQDVF